MNELNDFKERLAYALDKKKMNGSDLARMTGISRAMISHYLNGDHPAPPAKVQIMADSLKVSYDWLKLGEGNFNDDPVDDDKKNNALYKKIVRLKKLQGGWADLTHRLSPDDVQSLLVSLVR